MDKLTKYQKLIERILTEYVELTKRHPNPDEDIVLAFHEPKMREYTEFAVAPS